MIVALKENSVTKNFIPLEFAKAFGVGFAILLLVWTALWLTSTPDLQPENGTDDSVPSLTILIERDDVSHTSQTQGTTTSPSKHPESMAVPLHVPEGLYEQTPEGLLLPVIRKEDGYTSFHAFQKEFNPRPDSEASVALVLMDYGLSDYTSETVLQSLPKNVTLLLSPYADTPQNWADKAYTASFEFWLALALHPRDYPSTDSGPHTLLMNVNAEQNRRRLDWHLSRAQGYAGLISRNSSPLVYSGPDLNYVLTTLFERGLAFVDSQPIKNDAAWITAYNKKGFYAENNVWLDTPPDRKTIRHQLEELEQKALKKGYAIAFFNPYPTSLSEILEWSDTLGEKHIDIAPLSYVVKSAMLEQKGVRDYMSGPEHEENVQAKHVDEVIVSPPSMSFMPEHPAAAHH